MQDKHTSFAEYLELPGINWSSLKLMQLSALDYQHGLLTPSEDTPSKGFGRATHTAVLEPSRFGQGVKVYDSIRRGAAWDSFQRKNLDVQTVKQHEMDKIEAIVDAVRSHPEAYKLLTGGKAEQPIMWEDADTGLPCKGLVDYQPGDVIVDFKTARDITMRNFGRQAAQLGYYAQVAFYHDGLFGYDGAHPVFIIAVESSPPHDVGVFRVTEESLWAGRDLYRELLAKVKGCRESGKWPGKYPEITRLELPTWIWGDDDSITFGEE